MRVSPLMVLSGRKKKLVLPTFRKSDTFCSLLFHSAHTVLTCWQGENKETTMCFRTQQFPSNTWTYYWLKHADAKIHVNTQRRIHVQAHIHTQRQKRKDTHACTGTHSAHIQNQVIRKHMLHVSETCSVVELLPFLHFSILLLLKFWLFFLVVN